MRFVSIIIPCYNGEEFVGRAIESALQQTYPNTEIIVVDNNSTDDTPGVLERYREQFPEKITVLSELKKGASAARNRGLSEARGEWIQFLDADNELLPAKIENQLAVVADADADLVIGDRYKSEWKDGKQHNRLVKADINDPWSALIRSKLNSTSANLWKRTTLLKTDGWNENWATSEDYELLFRLLKSNVKIKHCPLPETIVHIRNNSLSRSTDAKRRQQVIDNAINLRVEIRKHLATTASLDAKLDHTIKRYIYERMMKVKRISPDYPQKKLKELDFSVPLKIVIGYKAKQFYGKLRAVWKH